MELDEAADQLYALSPAEFVAARDGLVRAAREAGDRGLAKDIGALRKPTAVGWLANLLARERQDQLGDFLALGEPLREASASLSGPALRELSRQRQQLVHALVQEARKVAGAAGPRVSEDVARGLESTLHAALADPDAAAQLAAGRLSGALSRTGFDLAPVDQPKPGEPRTGQKPARKPAPRSTKTSAAERRATQRAAKRAQVEAELARTWAEAREAAEEREMAASAAAEAATTYDDAKGRVVTLQQELRAAQERLTEAERARDGARAAKDRAKAAHQAADRAAERARKLVTEHQRALESLTR